MVLTEAQCGVGAVAAGAHGDGSCGESREPGDRAPGQCSSAPPCLLGAAVHAHVLHTHTCHRWQTMPLSPPTGACIDNLLSAKGNGRSLPHCEAGILTSVDEVLSKIHDSLSEFLSDPHFILSQNGVFLCYSGRAMTFSHNPRNLQSVIAV